MQSEPDFAFAMPGGESRTSAPSRPLDLDHLAKQTLGDRALEQEVLGLFIQQALSVRDKIGDSAGRERFMLAHGLTGAARGVGAFAVADCAAEIERNPDDNAAVKRLGALIDEVRDFVAAISR